eukprot:604601-Rhodomonas_salina.5
MGLWRSGTEIAYGAMAIWRGSGRAHRQRRSAISLRAPYAMSGTDIAYGATSPRALYAMSGTDRTEDAIELRDAWFSTDVVYAPMPASVLTSGMVLPGRLGRASSCS